MEEYIKKLLEQIRFRKAHKAIGDEIRVHIEEQISANISEGMDKETAEKKAVEDMGDPVDAGIALDKVHRPQIAYSVIIIALVATVIGIIVNALLSRGFTAYNLEDAARATLSGSEIYIFNAFLGISVMLIMYLVDYTEVAGYSRVAAITILGSYAVYSFVTTTWAYDYNVKSPAWYTFVEKTFGLSGSLMFWIVPLFAGILYKYRGQRYRALISSFLWIIATGVIASRQDMGIRTAIIVICMLIELTLAIKNGWLEVPKTQAIATAWTLFTVLPVGLTWFMYKFRLMSLYQCNVVRTWFIPDSDMEKTRGIIRGMSLVGSGIISYFSGGFTSTEPTSNCVRNMYGGEYVLTDIIALWGMLAVLGTVTVVAGLIVFGFVAVSKTKNQLGIVMGSGCMMWLTINAFFNLGVGFGLLKVNRYSFFPFLSARHLVASYAILGIILSIYKYKNAYPQHVDISGEKI